MIIIYFLLLFNSSSFSQISEQEISQHVLSQFPSIKMAQEDVKIASADLLTAEGAFDISLQGNFTEQQGFYDYRFLQSRIVKPTSLFGLDLYAGFRKSTGNIPVYDGQLETLNKGEWSFGAKLPLLRGFLIDERRANLKKSELQKDQRLYQLQASELEHLRNALHKYWDWKFALQRYQIQKNLLETANQRNLWLEKRAKAGDIARFELNDNQRSILQRESLLLQAEQTLTAARSELEYYIIDESLRQKLILPQPPELITHVPPLTPLSPEELTSMALERRPEFKAIYKQKEQNEVDKDLQRNRYWPQLDIEAQHSQDEGHGPSNLTENNTKIGLQLEIPLQYRRIKGRNAQIEGNIHRLNHQIRLLEQKVRTDIQIMRKNLQVSLLRRELALKEKNLAHSLENGERKRLQQGETNILMVNLREQASAEADLRFAETSVEALKHAISLKTLIGFLPHEELHTP